MSYAQNANDIKGRIEPIERKISSYPARDHELANMLVNSPPDERMGLESADCASDILKRLGGLLRRALQQELDNSFEISERLVGIDYLRHGAGFGRALLRPPIRALR